MEAGEKDTKPRIEVIDSENRRYPRFDIQLPIEFDQIKSSITHTGNISEGGLLIYLAEEADVSQYVRLKLFISLGSELNTIEVLAEVVWTDNHLSKDQEYYPCGVKFVDISPEDDAKLKNVLKKLSSPLDEKGKDWTPKKPTETDDMTELQKVVVRYRDGRIIKGFTRNFFPNKDLFHVSPPDDPYGEGKRVQMRELKAVFLFGTLTGTRSTVNGENIRQKITPLATE